MELKFAEFQNLNVIVASERRGRWVAVYHPSSIQGIISITDGYDVRFRNPCPILRLKFEDNTGPTSLISEDHARQIVEFARSLPANSNLLVHCFAGVSRSSAAAMIAIMATHPELEPSEVEDRLRKVFPKIIPNEVLVRKGLKVLNDSTLRHARDC